MSTIHQINQHLDQVFQQVITKFKQENISVVMATYFPQRGEILCELASKGVETVIAGGLKGTRAFKEIPQYGMEEDTMSCYDGFPIHITKGITELLPESSLKNRKVALFAYVNNLGWGNYVMERGLNTKIVATVEQNLRSYFEEKGNLLKILKTAGLSAYIIPTEHVDDKTSIEDLTRVYNSVKNEAGRVVVQACNSKRGNAAGKGTVFIDSLETFIDFVKQTEDSKYKVVRFVNGSESNLSFFAGNTKADENMLGSKKANISEDLDVFNPDILDDLLANAKELGINENNIVTVVGRGTLKAVGDEHLTGSESNGVGNDIGYVYPDKINAQITEIGTKLSRIMALSGKVGIAGADLIIDRTGKVWINEINDRQQGPTAQMSKDADSNNIPSLLKISLLSSFADFKDETVQRLFKELQQSSMEIHHAYTHSSGEFYLKMNSTHPKDAPEKVQHNLQPGFYEITKQKDGSWKFNFASYRRPDSQTPYETNPDTGRVIIKVVGASWRTGDIVDTGSQLFRLTGVTNPQNPPFIIKDGKTRLNESWHPVVQACYEYMFGAGYTQKNPLWQQRHPQNQPIFIAKHNALTPVENAMANQSTKISEGRE